MAPIAIEMSFPVYHAPSSRATAAAVDTPAAADIVHSRDTDAGEDVADLSWVYRWSPHASYCHLSSPSLNV